MKCQMYLSPTFDKYLRKIACYSELKQAPDLLNYSSGSPIKKMSLLIEKAWNFKEIVVK